VAEWCYHCPSVMCQPYVHSGTEVKCCGHSYCIQVCVCVCVRARAIKVEWIGKEDNEVHSFYIAGFFAAIY